MSIQSLRHVTGALALVLVTETPLFAQAPEGPPPPSQARVGSGAHPYELLPEIGQIGAQVSALVGPAWNPYGAGRGAHAGGFVDLPLFRAPGGKISYEIVLDLARTKEETSRLYLLHIAPFGLKYTLHAWDSARLRPYVVAGLDYLVVFTEEESDFFADEARARFGIHVGTGLEVRLSQTASLNVDYRYTAIEETSDRSQVLGVGLGLHW